MSLSAQILADPEVTCLRTTATVGMFSLLLFPVSFYPEGQRKRVKILMHMRKVSGRQMISTHWGTSAEAGWFPLGKVEKHEIREAHKKFNWTCNSPVSKKKKGKMSGLGGWLRGYRCLPPSLTNDRGLISRRHVVESQSQLHKCCLLASIQVLWPTHTPNKNLKACILLWLGWGMFPVGSHVWKLGPSWCGDFFPFLI